MNNNKNKLSHYIDMLNAEHKPKEKENAPDTQELEKLYDVVRLVRTLKEPTLPDAHYPDRLAKDIAGKLNKDRNIRSRKKPWFIGIAAVAAILIMTLTLNNVYIFNKPDFAYAMEKAFEGIKAYHGFLEIASTNAQGKTSPQGKLEVWADKEGHYYVKQLEGSQKGLVTVNNGERKWQALPDDSNVNAGEKIVNIFPAFPDPYSFSFELGKEIEQVKNALSTKVIGEETIAGRKASILLVSPKGGEPYHIWIDKDTKLPLKNQSAWNNGLQYTITYTEIEFNDSIPLEFMTYKRPDGFTEVSSNPEFKVTTIEEAQNIVGFTVKVPENIPSGYTQTGITVDTNKNSVKLYYKAAENSENTRIVLLQGKANEEFKPASTSILGKVNEMQVEIQSPIQGGGGIIDSSLYKGVTGLSSIRWQQYGRENAVIGNTSIEILSAFVNSLMGETVVIISPDGQPFKPQIEVPVDMDIVKNEQKSVDGGHSPWQLDPAFVAQVFISLKISPGGIVGDYPIKEEDLKVVQNNGIETIIEVSGEKTPISKVYLKRLIRQDATGIWTVVGYDPAGKK